MLLTVAKMYLQSAQIASRTGEMQLQQGPDRQSGSQPVGQSHALIKNASGDTDHHPFAPPFLCCHAASPNPSIHLVPVLNQWHDHF